MLQWSKNNRSLTGPFFPVVEIKRMVSKTGESGFFNCNKMVSGWLTYLLARYNQKRSISLLVEVSAVDVALLDRYNGWGSGVQRV